MELEPYKKGAWVKKGTKRVRNTRILLVSRNRHMAEIDVVVNIAPAKEYQKL